MMALDRGGECRGVACRLAARRHRGESREPVPPRNAVSLELALPARWINLKTVTGPLRAIAFVIDRKSGRYVSGLSLDTIADALATAVGERGSMADYLYMTVKHLEDHGIHDRHLWRLQELVAERLEGGNGAGGPSPA